MENEPTIKGDEAPPAPPETPEPVVEAAPAPPPQDTPVSQDAPAPAKSGGGKGMIVAIAVIAVVAIVVIAFMFMGGGIEGKWETESIKAYDADGTLNQTMTDDANANMPADMWMEFKSDGTAATFDDPDGSDSTWETDGDQLSVTSTEIEEHSTTVNGTTTWDNQTVTSTVTFTYSVSGDTLTLEMTQFGMTIEYTAKRV